MVAAGPLKNVALAPSIQADTQLRTAIEQANRALVQVLGESADTVKVSWDSEPDDRGRPSIRLTLKDWSGEKTGKFALNEFSDSPHLWRRLYSLWGDLLSAQANVRVREMKEAVGRLSSLEG